MDHFKGVRPVAGDNGLGALSLGVALVLGAVVSSPEVSAGSPDQDAREEVRPEGAEEHAHRRINQ